MELLRLKKMTTNRFIVEDFDELIALQRVFREAKFCVEPDDVEISDSPIVARMFKRLVDALMAEEVARDGEIARQNWQRWLMIDESRDEWAAAVRRARGDVRWEAFSEEERTNYVSILLSPFVLTSDALARFISEV